MLSAFYAQAIECSGLSWPALFPITSPSLFFTRVHKHGAVDAFTTRVAKVNLSSVPRLCLGQKNVDPPVVFEIEPKQYLDYPCKLQTCVTVKRDMASSFSVGKKRTRA